MLLQELQEMGRSDSLEKLSRSTARAAEGLGFERFGLLLVTPAKEPNRIAPGEIFSNGQRFASLDNVPAEYLAAYQEIGYDYVDPVMRHARESTHPLVWGRTEYENSGAMEHWEQQAPFGYAEGMVVAAHLPNGVHVVVGLECADPITTEPVALTRQLADFQLFAQFAVAPIIELLQQKPPEPEPSDSSDTKLTARELECLFWASNAKTAWETGQILGISERTVAQHLANARRKLDCLTKLQAAMKAVQLGLITQ